tara:strand:- start:147 stop:620 length:474 start_codon:yes stop_codon:yes gene_type:complete
MKLKFSNIFFYFILSYLFIVESTNSETNLGPQYLKYELSWCLDSTKCIALEVADTPIRRQIGLMQRPPLLVNTGMIFIFDKPTNQKFWMFNTLHPLDIIFIKNNKVIHLEENAVTCNKKPCSLYGPDHFYDYVIELKAGDIKRFKINISDLVKLNRI